MVDTIIRYFLLLLSAFSIFGICFLSYNGSDWNVGLVFTAGLTSILAALFPALHEFTAKFGKDGGEFSLKKRHEAPEPERKKIIEMAQVTDKQIEITDDNKKLIESAKERPDKERSPEDYMALATEAWRTEKFDEVLKYAFAGLNLNSKDIRIKATLINILGVGFGKLGNNELAIQYYNNAMIADPQLYLPHYNLGILYCGQRKYDEAEKECREAIRLKPTNADAHNNLGSIYFKQQKFDEAEEAFREVIRLKPDYTDAQKNLEMVLQKKNEMGE